MKSIILISVFLWAAAFSPLAAGETPSAAVVAPEEKPPVKGKPRARKKSVPAKEVVVPTTVRAVPEALPTATEVRIDPLTVHHWYKYNTRMGVAFGGGSTSGFSIGGQFGYAPFYPRALYFGPSVDFVLFDPGSGILALASVWHELAFSRAFTAGRLLLGAGGGGAFMSQVPGKKATELCVLGDLGVIYPVSDLAALKGQIRAGLLGGDVLTLVTFNVEFRFI